MILEGPLTPAVLQIHAPDAATKAAAPRRERRSNHRDRRVARTTRLSSNAHFFSVFQCVTTSVFGMPTMFLR